LRLLLDTHILLWTVLGDERLPSRAAALIREADLLYFSAVTIWEVAIKSGRRQSDFSLDPCLLRRRLLTTGYVELGVTGLHAAAAARLPDLHKDPFDRLLAAQAMEEELVLVTADVKLAGYPGRIARV
jgi:PIN domain nuclease of toxin-antitoxin system